MNETIREEAGAAAVATAPLLTYDAARRYAPTVRWNLAGAAVVFIAGLLASILAGLVVWVWLTLRLPSFYVLPMIAQGALVGLAIAWLCRRLRVRNLPLVIGIGICCGVFSAFCLQGVVYLASVHDLAKTVQMQIWSQGYAEDSPQAQKLLSRIRASPYTAFDAMVLAPKGARRRGYLGFMEVRKEEVWVFTILEALISAGIATGVAIKILDRPFCETCGTWFAEPYTAVRVPVGVGEALARAIEADDATAALALAHRWQSERASQYARATVCHCPKCRRAIAQVRNDKTKVKRAARVFYGRHFVSEQTVQALRSSPAVEVPEEPAALASGPAEGTA